MPFILSRLNFGLLLIFFISAMIPKGSLFLSIWGFYSEPSIYEGDRDCYKSVLTPPIIDIPDVTWFSRAGDWFLIKSFGILDAIYFCTYSFLKR